MQFENCPICLGDWSPVNALFGLNHVDCPTCGRYIIAWEALSDFRSELKDGQRRILSGLLREASEAGSELTITGANVEELLSSASLPDGPFETIDRILMYIQRKSDTDHSIIRFSPETDKSIVYGRTSKDLIFYLKKCVQLQYLEQAGESNDYRLDLEGWKRLAKLRETMTESSQAFVAMWFSDQTIEAWNGGFEPALLATGYEPIRMDMVEHNEMIDERIIAEIRRSGLLVADFTGNRSGVYFEAGFAKGLGIDVIWTCRKDEIDQLHFDTRQFNHIDWESPDDLKKRLVTRIEATLPTRKKRGSASTP